MVDADVADPRILDLHTTSATSMLYFLQINNPKTLLGISEESAISRYNSRVKYFYLFNKSISSILTRRSERLIPVIGCFV
jgi:hypothetical protein